MMAVHRVAMDPWTLSTTDLDTGCVYLANGYLGTLLSPDGGLLGGEAGAWHMRGLYVAGEPYAVDRLAVLPSLEIRLDIDARVAGYRRDLDLRRALVSTWLDLEETRGRLRVEHHTFFSRADRHRVVRRLHIRPDFNGMLKCSVALGPGASADIALESSRPDASSILLRGQTNTYGVEVATCIRFVEDRWTVKLTTDDGGMACHLQTEILAGEDVTLTQLITVASALECDLPVELSLTRPGEHDELFDSHRAAWENLWQADIEIEGDPEVQQFARAGLFSLWSSVWPDDRWSIAPMGLSSNGYNGHIFWDAEFWMYPPLLLTHPDLACSCVTYRERTAAAAEARSSGNGMQGTQYPWEAAYTGEEMTPAWADTRDFQLHITADVAIGQWWYFLNTGDLAWLREHGYPVIRSCADYWASRVEWHADHDHYEISDVVCADEYAAHVNNDAFTNAAVTVALRIAIRASTLVGVEAPPEWAHIAENMHVPYDNEHGRYLEYDGFDGRLTKQADVELLAFPLEYVRDSAQIARDLDYYADVIDPDGPAMSFSVYSIVSAQLGRGGDALTYLRRSFVPNTRPPFWLFSETPTNDEFHFCTGVGGALQALLFGFSGVRLREGYFVVDPLLPPGWSQLCLRGLWLLGARTDIDIRPDGFTVRRHTAEGAVELCVRREHGGATLEVSATTERGAPLCLHIPEALNRANECPDHCARLSLQEGGEQRVHVTTEGGESVLDVCLRGRGTSSPGESSIGESGAHEASIPC